MITSLLLALACNGGKVPPAQAGVVDAGLPPTPAELLAQQAPGAAAEPLAPTDAGYAVYRALSVRDPEPTCAEVEALSPTPVETLREVVDRAQQPPWAGMRAANCLVQGHGAEVQADLVAWVGGADTRGLALLVLDQLDLLPEDVALAVATAALAGPHAADASARVPKSRHPALQALVP
ncbi:hypothetical protein L6R53_24250 [Myxococcota bacterium]|nr:hypothetical protein [Myxococcota bacterium]